MRRAKRDREHVHQAPDLIRETSRPKVYHRALKLAVTGAQLRFVGIDLSARRCIEGVQFEGGNACHVSASID
ncbi:hypothetical protein [Bradyrhizobium embrapense]